MSDLLMSLKLARRDWRAGELRLLVGALLIAVAALASVGLLVDRMERALALQARQLLGADLVVASSREPRPELIEAARREGLSIATTLVFPSMASASASAVPADRSRPVLVSVKAASPDYPLRGALRVATAPGEADQPAAGMPARGETWVDAQLLPALGVAVGDRLKLGDSEFRITRMITLEPDRGASFINFAPRVLIPLADLPATRLVQPASRVSWRLLVAGEPAPLERFEAWLKTRGEAQGERVETVDNGRPELGATLTRAEQFLSLVALLTALISAVAIALGARRFAERHLDACAVMKAAGLGQRRLMRLLLLELLWVAMAGALSGVLLGVVVHHVLISLLAPFIPVALPAPGLAPLVQAAAAAVLLLAGFGAWPFMRLAGVPPLRVLRRDQGPVPRLAWMGAVLALVAFALLLIWLAGDPKIALLTGIGFLAATLVFIGVSAAGAQLLAPLRHAGWLARWPFVRLAIASWSRRRTLAIVQTASLSAGIMALLLLTVTRTDLIDAWRQASPPDAPNRFVINIQPDQRDLVARELQTAGVGAELYPMIRGRLIEINDRDAGEYVPEADRAQRMIQREFNLSYTEHLPDHNQLVEGRWFSPQAMEVSAEQGIMKTLGLSLGDRLVFDIAGEPVGVTITSVRKLSWDSMKANFFMILSPGALADRPQTFLTAFHQPASGAEPLDQQLVRRHPNLTVFDTGNMVRQIQTMLDQVVAAVQLLFVLTLAAGLVVLWGALLSSRDERLREAALMRALGASRTYLQRAQITELALSGGLAGALGALGSMAVGWAIAANVFEFSYQVRWSVIPLTAAVGALLSIAVGWFGLRQVLRAPVLASLRAA
jgi:putative ABC transport system permease protein